MDKMVQVLGLMSGQLERLTSFSRTMKTVRSLEDYPVERETRDLESLYQKIRGILESLSLGGEIQLSLTPASLAGRGSF